MIRLHHGVSARSFRPLWLLEELGLPHELVMHAFPPRVHDEALLEINPLGTVPAYGDYLNFLHFGEATLTFPQTLVLRYGHFEPPLRRQPQVVEDYARWCLSRLRTLVPRLEREPFICAGRFTAADVSVGYALLLASHIGLEERFKPAVADYWARLQQREAFRRALTVEREAALAQGVSPEPAMRVGGSA